MVFEILFQVTDNLRDVFSRFLLSTIIFCARVDVLKILWEIITIKNGSNCIRSIGTIADLIYLCRFVYTRFSRRIPDVRLPESNAYTCELLITYLQYRHNINIL